MKPLPESSAPKIISKRKQEHAREIGKLGGRPKVYTDEILAELAEKLEDWARQHTSCYLETFCRDNYLWPERLAEFAKENPRFASALKFARSSLACNLAEATAGGEMPPAFGIFALKNVGKWSDKQEVEHSGEIKNTVQVYIPAKK